MTSNINTFDIEFFEVVHIINKPITSESIDTLKKILLKLNNPTFFSKFTKKHPANVFGYYNNKTINPIIIAITNMLSIIRSDDSADVKTKKLQIEYSWAFNNYNWYNSLATN
jgi:hypothetical protein